MDLNFWSWSCPWVGLGQVCAQSGIDPITLGLPFLDSLSTGKRSRFGWLDLLKYRLESKFVKLYQNLLKSIRSILNWARYAKIWSDLEEIKPNLDEIWPNLKEILSNLEVIRCNLDEISKRLSQFSTNWTKTICEMLPSVENNYFSNVIWLGRFFRFFMFKLANRPASLEFWR